MYSRVLKHRQLDWLTEVSLACNESLAVQKLLENGPLTDKEFFEEYLYLSETIKPALSDGFIQTLHDFKSSNSVALLVFNGRDRWLMRMFGLNGSERLLPVSNDFPYVCKT